MKWLTSMKKTKHHKVLEELDDIMKAKNLQFDEYGDYKDKNLENGTYAQGYRQALIDFYKLMEK